MAGGDNNIMVILSSPSGAGKTTITKKFNKSIVRLNFSVSHTTRKPRSNEVDGVGIILSRKLNSKNLISQKNFTSTLKYLIITMAL